MFESLGQKVDVSDIEEMMKEDDFREGVAALIEKRPPKWPSLPKKD